MSRSETTVISVNQSIMLLSLLLVKRFVDDHTEEKILIIHSVTLSIDALRDAPDAVVVVRNIVSYDNVENGSAEWVVLGRLTVAELSCRTLLCVIL
jgi:hypothetical protein